MKDWTFTFRLEQGKRYDIQFVRVGSTQVERAILDYTGIVMGEREQAVLVTTDSKTVPGPIDILAINEVSASGRIVDRA